MSHLCTHIIPLPTSSFQCYIYKGLPKINGKTSYGVREEKFGCPEPIGVGWIYGVSETDGRNNRCCEDMLDHTPHNFQGAAVDGNHCWLTKEATTTLSDGTTYTGKWIGYMAGDTSDKVLEYATLAEAKAAGCGVDDSTTVIESLDSAAQAVNPASLLVTAMVATAFGLAM